MENVLSEYAKAKRDLLVALWDLYKHNDISEISVTKVCRKAGYHRTTFYKYFSGIDDALDLIIQSMEKSQIDNVPLFVDFLLSEFDPAQIDRVYSYLEDCEDIINYMRAKRPKYEFLFKFLDLQMDEFIKACAAKGRIIQHQHGVASIVFSSVTAITLNKLRDNRLPKHELVRLIHDLTRKGPLAVMLAS